MKVKLFAVSGLILLISSILVFAQGGDALISLATPAGPVRAGDTFAVNIQVDGADGVYGTSVELLYDPQALEVVAADAGAVTPGDFFGDQPSFTLKNTADASAGMVEYALTLRQPAQPVTGSGILGSLQFRVLRDGPAQIEVSNARLIVPQFEEVNGRLVARQVSEMPVQVQNMSLVVDGSAAQVVVEQPEAIAAVQQPPPVLQAPAVQPDTPVLVTSPVPGTPPTVLLGLVFFSLGLLLFALSVGTYVRLHRQFSWQDSY